jgi:putative membrane protein
MMNWYGHGIGGWGYGLTTLIMILFWAAVIYAIVALVRYTRPNGARRPEPVQPPTPERLLAERFARGEIDEDEYHQRLTSLRAAGPAGTERRA